MEEETHTHMPQYIGWKRISYNREPCWRDPPWAVVGPLPWTADWFPLYAFYVTNVVPYHGYVLKPISIRHHLHYLLFNSSTLVPHRPLFRLLVEENLSLSSLANSSISTARAGMTSLNSRFVASLTCLLCSSFWGSILINPVNASEHNATL